MVAMDARCFTSTQAQFKTGRTISAVLLYTINKMLILMKKSISNFMTYSISSSCLSVSCAFKSVIPKRCKSCYI